MGLTRISPKLLNRVRDYAVEEPSYTVAFAAWELKLSKGSVNAANAELLRLGIVEQVEERKGPFAAVYAYKPVPGNSHSRARRVGLPELDASNTSRRAVAGAEAVPYTGKPKGPSGKPRRTSPHRVRRAKTKGVKT
jgi:hypothetical protein